jgi:hypothetical protein
MMANAMEGEKEITRTNQGEKTEKWGKIRTIKEPRPVFCFHQFCENELQHEVIWHQGSLLDELLGDVSQLCEA